MIVLLALLSLGVKNIHLGPTLPVFLWPNVVKVLVEKFSLVFHINTKIPIASNRVFRLPYIRSVIKEITSFKYSIIYYCIINYFLNSGF